MVWLHAFKGYSKKEENLRDEGDVLKMHIGSIVGKSDKILDLVISKSKTLHT